LPSFYIQILSLYAYALFPLTEMGLFYAFFGVRLMFAYTPASLEAIHANRESLLAALIKLNITEVIIRYEGGGDSGDVTELEVKPETVIHNLPLNTYLIVMSRVNIVTVSITTILKSGNRLWTMPYAILRWRGRMLSIVAGKTMMAVQGR
jgi:hypothetical protein